jgi:hypothetical protein
MRVHKVMSGVACVAAIVMLVALTGCGSTISTTTTAAPAPTSSTAVTSTTAGPTSTTATVPSSVSTSVTAPAETTTSSSAGSAVTPEMQAYTAAMTAFMDAFDTAPDTSFLDITDPATATAADLKAADEASTFIHRLQDQLDAMKPPAQVKSLHDSFVQVIKGEVASMDDFINALKDKDAAKMKTAHDALVQNVAQMEPVLTQLGLALGMQ